MSERSPSILISDMREAVSRILSYCEGFNFQHFVEDQRTMDAVLRNLQILGEAAYRVPLEVQSLAPNIEWSRIIRSRHIIVHDYFGIDAEIVWRIVDVHLPDLQPLLDELLDRLHSQSW